MRNYIYYAACIKKNLCIRGPSCSGVNSIKYLSCAWCSVSPRGHRQEGGEAVSVQCDAYSDSARAECSEDLEGMSPSRSRSEVSKLSLLKVR